MKTKLLIELLSWEEARAHASPIRFAVFVEEQGVPREIELDEHDPVSIHVVAFDDQQPVATGRLLPDGHIGRMAVLKDWRGRGIGALDAEEPHGACEGERAMSKSRCRRRSMRCRSTARMGLFRKAMSTSKQAYDTRR